MSEVAQHAILPPDSVVKGSLVITPCGLALFAEPVLEVASRANGVTCPVCWEQVKPKPKRRRKARV